ncbi:AbrB family transcriptional regulator [Enterococcus sp. RIT-PI-f]|uniref:AbrB family transcriptional regulator n=1 Tax=Enterococcus sp. RIT-PI-f TaxID=1690244 RepID=UPI000A54DD23
MIIQIVFTLLIALIGGLIFKRMKIPAAFMTGGMIAVAILSILTNQMAMPRSMKFFAQVISGAYIGQQSSRNTFLQLKHLILPIIFLMSLFTINSFILGAIFVHFFSMDWTTALLSCLPGGIMDVSLISIDMGANAEIVATMQLARLVGMLIILPQWSKLILTTFAKKNKQQKSRTNKDNQSAPSVTIVAKKSMTNDIKILFIAFIGGSLGVFLGIPVGALIFALLFSFMYKLRVDPFSLSPYVRYGAQILAASIIGSTFTMHSLSQMKTLVFPIIILFIGFLLVNITFTLIVSHFDILDTQSAIFASSPAGATDISLIAADLGGDLTSIASIQITRTLFAIVVLPQLINFFIHMMN